MCTPSLTLLCAWQTIANAHARELAQVDEQRGTLSKPTSELSPEKEPPAQAKMSGSTPSSQQSLLQQTQAANLVIPTEVPSSPAAAHIEAASHQPLLPEAISNHDVLFPGFPEGHGGQRGSAVSFLISWKLTCAKICRRIFESMCFEKVSIEGHLDMAVRMQDDDADLRELLHMLQNEDSCSDEEGDGHSRLMELAAAVASQPNVHARLSQALSQMVRHVTTLLADRKLGISLML